MQASVTKIVTSESREGPNENRPGAVRISLCGEFNLLSGDEHARRPLHKMDGVFFFFSFCRSVVGTSGLALSATSGPLILQVLRKI